MTQINREAVERDLAEAKANHAYCVENLQSMDAKAKAQQGVRNRIVQQGIEYQAVIAYCEKLLGCREELVPVSENGSEPGNGG